MGAFWDTDVLLKLSAMDLLEETLQLLDVDTTSVFVAPSAPHYIRKKRNLQQRYGAEGLERARRFVNTVQIVSTYDESTLKLLSEVRDIGSGEAILIAGAVQTQEFLFLTGDKRALEALTQVEACKTVVNQLQGRVVCLEQIVLKSVQGGFTQTQAKIASARECDTAIKVAFGSGLQATQETVEQALRHYIEDLRRKTAGMLIDW